MKNYLRNIFLLMVVLFFSACSGLDGSNLTAAVGLNAQNSAKNDSDTLVSQVNKCEGEVDFRTNVMQISLQLETDHARFDLNSNDVVLIGGATWLMDRGVKPEGLYQFSCKGTGEITADPIRINGRTAGWIAAMSLPEIVGQGEANGEQTMANITPFGIVSTSVPAVEEMISQLSGNNAEGSVEAFFTSQKLLYENYANTDFVREAALKAGLSSRGADLLAQIYVEPSEAKQQAFLMDLLTSPEDSALAEATLGATVKLLLTTGATQSEISDAFNTETGGRIQIVFEGNVGSGGNLSLKIDHDGEGDNAGITTYVSSGEGADSGGANSGSPGEGSDPSNPGEGNDPGNPGDGNTPGDPGDGDTPGDPDPGDGEEPKERKGIFGKLLSAISTIVQHAAAGAALGSLAGPEGAVPGAVVGGAFGVVMVAAEETSSNVYDPEPDNPNSPCKSPIVLC